MQYLSVNGKFVPAGDPIIPADNRGLRFGDGLFETMKCLQSKIILLDEHLDRLWTGMQALKFDLPKHFTQASLSKDIIALLQKNNLENARIRLSMVRGNGGLYDPQTHVPVPIIQCWPYESTSSQLNQNGLQLCIYRQGLKSTDSFSNLKHNNFLVYAMAAMYAKEEKCNDAVVLNSRNDVCESTIANIFCVRDQIVYTPPLSEGCIAGIMRKQVITDLNSNGIDVIELPISEHFLTKCQEIFLTNSMYNVRWVAALGDVMYGNTYTSGMYKLLQKTNPLIYC